MPKASVITKEFQAIQAALEVLEPLDPTQRQFAVSTTRIPARVSSTGIGFQGWVESARPGGCWWRARYRLEWN